jgi:hypothetical protein
MVASVSAQSAGQPAWRQFASTLPPHAFVDVRLKDGTHFEGHFIEVAGDALRVMPKRRMAVPFRDVAFADIQSIEPKREAMSPGAKVLIGIAAAGSAILVVILVTLAQIHD